MIPGELCCLAMRKASFISVYFKVTADACLICCMSWKFDCLSRLEFNALKGVGDTEEQFLLL